MIEIDAAWLHDHPLPAQDGDTDKNERGRVLAVGGSAFVPGALRLTGEAALRAGAGKLQLATIAGLAPMLGMAIPEAAVIALRADGTGEIDGASAAEALARPAAACDALVLGPGMGDMAEGSPLLTQLLAALKGSAAAVLDAAAIAVCRDCKAAVRARSGRVVLTPHIGEMAALTGRDADWIVDNMAAAARDSAADLNAVIVLKSGRTVIAPTDGDTLLYPGGGPGLATGGSGDVLAGVLAGLLARGAPPVTAAGWAVWAHGEAGRVLGERYDGIGLLARELVDRVPKLLNERKTRGA